ncbi:MAG: FecR domain-containing protein [Fidelibacterota bacterium]|nr:MAG: FecR domain-containing protein [Candidatus Neomarinimicrobiota bacterium]
MSTSISSVLFSISFLRKMILTSMAVMLALPLFAQQEPIARVVKSQGEVLLRRQAESQFATALQPAMDLFNGDAIRASENGFASLIFLDDKTLLKLKESSQFQFVETENARTIDMQYGTIRSTLPQPIKSFRVETPVSVASVKGTDFWLIHDLAAGIDRAYGMEGLVEIFNTISQITQNLTPNTMIISTAGGQVTPPIPVSPEEMPVDPDEAVPEPEPEPEAPEEEEAPEVEEEVDVGVEEAPLEDLFIGEEPPVEEPAAAVEAVEEEAVAAKKAGPGFGLGLGSVTIDGVVYYQLALRPEFTIGKFGIGLDLVGYMDAQGNFRNEEWDEPSDYLDKLLYLRYGTDQDPFFFKIGAMPQVQYGFGALMSNYSNMTEFPQVRRVGFELGGRITSNMRLKGFTADLKEGGGLVGLRGTYRVSDSFPLTFGINVVTDLNQYGGLKDKDGDGVPDLLDDFPDDKHFDTDSDGDGLADSDSLEFDIDGDGWTDNSPYPDRPNNDIDGIDRKPEPFNKETESRSILGISADISYPIFSSNAFSLVAYTEAGMLNYGDTLKTMAGEELLAETSGFGLVGPGLRAQILKFLNLSLEYRYTTPLFQPGFFNSTYDLERAQFIASGATAAPDSVVTKDQVSITNPYALSGYYGSATANLFNIVNFTAGYQQLIPTEADTLAEESNSFIANLSVNTDLVPKISEAVAYYIRNNDPNPFEFKKPSANTTWGYRFGYELGPGVSLVYSFQESYRDLNGNGSIDSKDEKVRLLSVETAFSF